MSIIDILSNRELAWFSWALILLTASLFSASFRISFLKLVFAFFNRKFFSIWLLMVFYFSQITFLLWYLNLWDATLLKDSIFFVIFSASVTFLNAYKIDAEKRFFKKMIGDSVKLGMFIEFLIGLYTFNFFTEFLIFPVGVLLALLLSVSENDAKYLKVKKLINMILTFIGLYLIYHVITAAIYHYKELFILENLKEILITPIYTLLLIPFFYILSVYMVYEVQNIILDTAIRVPTLKSTARKYAFRYFFNDLNGLKRWVRRMQFLNPQTQEDLLKSITELKSHLLLEQSPPVVSTDQGWSPYTAVNFMDNEKLKAGNYEHTFDNEWGACSRYLYIGNKSFNNTLSYYVNGDEVIARSLELSLKIYTSNDSLLSHNELLNHAQNLFKKATDENLPNKMVEAIVKGKSLRLPFKHIKLDLKKEKWRNLTHGYDLIFTISISDRQS